MPKIQRTIKRTKQRTIKRTIKRTRTSPTKTELAYKLTEIQKQLNYLTHHKSPSVVLTKKARIIKTIENQGLKLAVGITTLTLLGDVRMHNIFTGTGGVREMMLSSVPALTAGYGLGNVVSVIANSIVSVFN